MSLSKITIRNLVRWAAPFAVLLCVTSASSVHAAPKFADIVRFPQSASSYLPTAPDAPITDYENQKIYASEFLRRYFAPWQNQDLSYLDLTADKVRSLLAGVGKRRLFTGNGKPFPAAELAKIVRRASVDLEAPPVFGIAIADADVRMLPTGTALYPGRDSALGERGLLRMDVLQNSTIKPGEPLAVFGSGGDASWLFVATGSVIGWVRSKAVAFVDSDLMDRFMESEWAVFVKDNVRVRDGDGVLRCTAKMGTILPREGDSVLLPVRGPDGRATIVHYKPESGDTAVFPVPFTPRNAVRAMDQLLKERYSWGGANGLRDCSAMTRDYFALFGIWLPRNSGDQAKTGASISLGGISAQEKLRAVVERGIPFATMVYMPGHVMLYVGIYDAEPVVLHNVWGVRIVGRDGRSGRAVIGRTVVTGLRVGQELPNRPKSSLFIDNVSALVFPMANVW